MANLLGQNIGTNYKGILNLGSTINTPVSGTAQYITDGDGTASALSVSTTSVGIGTAAPEAKLDARLTANTDLTQKITRFAANNVSGELKALDVSYTGSANLISIGANAVGADPSISVNLGNAEIARFTTNGLTFNGDTAAANALDDYEEGTWTMGISFGGAASGVTYAANTGAYTKIGRQVMVNGLMSLSSKGSSTGTAQITGLPFAIGSGASNYAAASLRFDSITFANQFQAYGGVTTTNIELEEITEAGVTSTLTNADFANGSSIMVSLTYFV
jgi:hypothetical protein